jgi:hypothetical protein
LKRPAATDPPGAASGFRNRGGGHQGEKQNDGLESPQLVEKAQNGQGGSKGIKDFSWKVFAQFCWSPGRFG